MPQYMLPTGELAHFQPRNMTLLECAQRLRDDLPISVELNPDMSKQYMFLIQPSWLFSRIGTWGKEELEELVIVTRIGDDHMLGESWYVRLDHVPLDCTIIDDHEFSAVLVWWLSCLLTVIEVLNKFEGKWIDYLPNSVDQMY